MITDDNTTNSKDGTYNDKDYDTTTTNTNNNDNAHN